MLLVAFGPPQVYIGRGCEEGHSRPALSLSVSRQEGPGITSVNNNWAMKGKVARKVRASRLKSEGLPEAHIRHLARGTSIDVLRQRSDDSRVEIKLLSDSDPHIYLVPADAIDARTARLMSIHRPPRHRRSSGLSLVPVDWKRQEPRSS
jgi:hypothetical protein